MFVLFVRVHSLCTAIFGTIEVVVGAVEEVTPVGFLLVGVKIASLLKIVLSFGQESLQVSLANTHSLKSKDTSDRSDFSQQ